MYSVSRAFFPDAFYLVRDIRIAWLVYIHMYCVPIATLNQNKQSQLLYLGDVQIIINILSRSLY